MGWVLYYSCYAEEDIPCLLLNRFVLNVTYHSSCSTSSPSDPAAAFHSGCLPFYGASSVQTDSSGHEINF